MIFHHLYRHYIGITAVTLKVFMKPPVFKVVVPIYIPHMCICIAYDRAIPLQTMRLTEIHPVGHEETHSRMFRAAVFFL